MYLNKNFSFIMVGYQKNREGDSIVMKKEKKKISYKKPVITSFGSVATITQSNKKANILDNGQENNQVGSNNII